MWNRIIVSDIVIVIKRNVIGFVIGCGIVMLFFFVWRMVVIIWRNRECCFSKRRLSLIRRNFLRIYVFR